jgi:F420-dependent oxidoreductase-like protein
MQLGLHLSRLSTPAEGVAAYGTALAATAQAAEEAGFRDLTLMDHWFQMEMFGGPPEPMLDGYTVLGFLAGQTQRVRLSLLVTGVTYRHPGLLAKTVATLDVLSAGRARLGIGAAWYEREHLGLGVPFPSTSERFERLEETLRICLQMWSDDDGPFEGRHYALAETVCEPRPVQRPHPPILVGGSGEKKTLRLVAQYADACNLFATTPEEVAHKLAVLDQHCADLGRDPATIERTMILGGDPLADVDAFVDGLAAYAAVGIETVSISAPDLERADWVREVGRLVVPRVADLSA